jgi:hypothetical protein
MDALKLLIDLTQALAWPLVALYALIYFRSPLRCALELLPEKLRNVSKVTVGSLSFEVQAYLQATGDNELLTVLPKVSRRAFEKLLDLKVTNHHYVLCARGTKVGAMGEGYLLRTDETLSPLRELEELGLVRFTEPLSEFVAFFETLPGYTTTTSYSGEGFVAIAPLAAEQVKRVDAEAYSLTDLGRRAYDAVFTVVVRQIGQR